MRKDTCKVYGYETLCVNGCCQTALLTDCQAAKKGRAGKIHARRK